MASCDTRIACVGEYINHTIVTGRCRTAVIVVAVVMLGSHSPTVPVQVGSLYVPQDFVAACFVGLRRDVVAAPQPGAYYHLYIEGRVEAIARCVMFCRNAIAASECGAVP